MELKGRALARLCIERLVPGGQGFARQDDGRPVFVPGAFPGDVIEPTRLTEKRQFARVEAFRLERPGPERREPPCAVFQGCGGCDWMPLPEDAQHQQKLALLREALARTGRFHEPSFPIEFRAVGPSLGYRSRVRLHVDDAGAMGYFARGSHRIQPAMACRVVTEELAKTIARLDEVRRTDPRSFSAFSEVEVRAFPGGGSLAFTLRRGRSLPRGLVRRLESDFVVEASVAGGQRLERWPTRGAFLLAAPGAFTQVNWDVNLALVDELLSGAARRGSIRFLDLYCGVGNFTMPLLGTGRSGLALDDDAKAIESARCAALEQGFDPDSFQQADVADWLARDASETFDLVIVDPPRAGLATGVGGLARRARHLFLCACDPVTFARDLRRLVDEGFSVESVTAYDMFPQTHHFEVSCWLSRSARPDQAP